MPTAAFDFDGTLILDRGAPNLYLIRRMRELKALGWNIMILTARNPEHERLEWIRENEPNRIRVLEFVEDFKLPVDRIIYRNHQPKAPVLCWCKVNLFYDDELHPGIPGNCLWVNTSIENSFFSILCPNGTNTEGFLFTKNKLDKIVKSCVQKEMHPYYVASAMLNHGFGILRDMIADCDNDDIKREMKCKGQEVLYEMYQLLKLAKTGE